MLSFDWLPNCEISQLGNSSIPAEPAIEGGLEAYVQSHGPEVVYEWIDVMLTDAIAKA
ncbi:MAG: hypothetical protein ACYDGM_07525 [Vulcanimicrobiaceae bacterium]